LLTQPTPAKITKKRRQKMKTNQELYCGVTAEKIAEQKQLMSKNQFYFYIDSLIQNLEKQEAKERGMIENALESLKFIGDDIETFDYENLGYKLKCEIKDSEEHIECLLAEIELLRDESMSKQREKVTVEIREAG